MLYVDDGMNLALVYDVADGVAQCFDPAEFERTKQQAMTSLVLQSTDHGQGVMF